MNLLLLAAVAANSFNLVCSGTLETSTFDSKETEPYTKIIRMDLDQKKWCEGECKALFDFVDIGPTQFTLGREDVNTVTERRFYSSRIDRETGKHSTLLSSGRRTMMITMAWEGQCEKQPFTGFPTFQTKF